MSIIPGVVWHMPIIDQKRRSLGMRWTTLSDQALWDVAIPSVQSGAMLINGPEAAARRWVVRPDIPENVVIEVPASCAQDPWWNEWVQDPSYNKVQVALNGRPVQALPEHWLSRLSYVIVPWKDDRRRQTNPGQPADNVQRGRRVPSLSSDIDNWYDAEKSFSLGIAAVIGWPWGVTAQALTMNASEQTLMLLLQQIQADADTSVLQKTMKQDPSITLKLMRYLASPLVGMGIEMRSLQQAMNFLGRDRLKRWLVLLMVNASKDVNQHPHRHRAMRRGWLLEKIGRRLDRNAADEMFMVGAFSMVDRLWGWGENDLRNNTALPGDVVDAIFKLEGPYGLALKMIEAMEDGSASTDWGAMALELGLTPDVVHQDFCSTIDEMTTLIAGIGS